MRYSFSVLPVVRLPRLFSRRTQASLLARVVVLSVATLSVAFFLPKEHDAFAPFVPQAPPQWALGDFDGDGRVDTALVLDRTGDRRISVQLSGSRAAVHLEAPVSGVIENDIDHDGDLDLVAATPTGDVLIWLNDGHGRFTRQAASRMPGFTSEPGVIHASWPEAPAAGISAPVLSAPAGGETAVVATRVRPPTARAFRAVRRTILPALRAPPSSLA